MTVALCTGAKAQKAWNIDRCMAYAVNHCSSVKIQKADTHQADINYKTAVAAFLPTLSAAVSTQYSWGRNINPATNTYNNVTTFNNYYELYASIPLFDGMQTINTLKQARLAKRRAQTATEKIQDDKAIEVMTRYADAAYAHASIALAEEKLSDSRRLLTKTQRLFELGERSKPDVAAIEAQVAEDDCNLTHQQSVARQTLFTLKTAMNFPMEDTLEIEDGDKETGNNDYLLTDTSFLSSHLNAELPELLTAKAKTNDAHYAYIIQRGAMMPKLTLNGAITTNYYKNLSQGGSAESFRSQWNNNCGEYIYLTLSIPIFTPSQWRNMKQARTNWEKAQIEQDDTRRKVSDSFIQAEMDCADYAKEIMQLRRKVSADSLAHHLNTRKFEEGMLSTFDLHTSAQTLLESRIKLLQIRMLLIIKNRLVEYYKGRQSWT